MFYNLSGRIVNGMDTREAYMCKCGKCGSKVICPVSFGLALGLTAGLATFLWAAWTIFYGPTAMMVNFHIPVPTWYDGTMHSLWALLKGFVFGFFVALFYDLIACCCKMRCCKQSTACTSTCSSPESKPDAGK